MAKGVKSLERKFSDIEKQLSGFIAFVDTFVEDDKEVLSFKLSQFDRLNAKYESVKEEIFSSLSDGEFNNFDGKITTCNKHTEKLEELQNMSKLWMTHDSLFLALEQRFENKRLIINKHINALLMLKYEKFRGDSNVDLRNLVDTCTKHLRALKLLNIEHNTFSELLLIQLVMQVLDTETKRLFEMTLESTDIPNNVHLADPTFNISNSIDALLSADIFFDILKDGKYKLDNEIRGRAASIEGFENTRCILLKDSVAVQLIGFADASAQAYGACLYVKSENANETQIRLLCSKTRVAHSKLCQYLGSNCLPATLLSKLTSKIVKIIDLEFDEVHLFSDSKVVLDWIQMQPHLLKVFVANRVSLIQ
ncbi:integrase catalytic domain-containing protein [Trichonephila clavata]|uniref:Integrase catalytic domain-containing protein n=1 Tax=Trichonephila clavata TaxID=2740835 RepID=A0A8X6KL21_TRICU|nr:integrase catalytic domain-containing protein [Trichonephila clavata]